jgi:hypothetical protein
VGVLIDLERMMSVEDGYSLVDQRIDIDHHAEDGVSGTSPPVVNIPVSRISGSSSSGIAVLTPQPSPKTSAA